MPHLLEHRNEEIHHYQLWRHNRTYTRLKSTTTNYVDILKHTHTHIQDGENYVDIIEYEYLF